MVRRVLQFIVIAFVVGEITMRFDERTLFFQNTRGEMLANTYKETREKTLIDRGALPIPLHDVRVMLLGDSKLYGVGIRPENSVAAIIRSRLRNDAVGGVYVLDLTEPGSNTFYNRRAFDEYVDAFVPQVVILAYNHNDVYGDQGEGRSAS